MEWEMGQIRLSKRVILCALGVSLIFPMIVFFILAPAIDKILIKESTGEAFRVADHIKEMYISMEEALRNESIPEAVKSEIFTVKEEFNLYKVSLFSEANKIIFSTDPKEIGSVIEEGSFIESVRSGKRYAAFKQKYSTSLEGYKVSADVVEAYVPVIRGDGYRGAIEVYYDITDAKEDFQQLKILVSIILFIVGFLMLTVITVYSLKVQQSKNRHKRAEEELSKEQLRTEAVFGALGDSVVVQDRDYRVIFQNRINKENFGDCTGELCFEAYEGKNDICEGCPVEQTFRDGMIHRTEREVTTKKGTRYYELVASPLKNEQDEIIAGVKVIRDITERRHLEDQLRHSQKMEAIGSLTGGISHEFNNILAAVRGYSEILQSSIGENHSLKKYADKIYQSTLKASKLTSGLLTYSRKQKVDFRTMNLNDFIGKTEEFLSQIIGSDIVLEMELCDDEIIINADSDQMEQVLINLAVNARDAMPGGGVLIISTEIYEMDDIFIHTTGYGAEGTYALIKIKDSGHGIDPDQRDRIFEPFFTTKEAGKGTGLGLSIVYGIIKKHNGYINVVSSPDKGTTFMIFIPLIDDRKE
jgi:signal transduction histidine kinase